ncbi:MAG: hypothetical protein O2939_09140 [Proteobacteria bacterium]|nr:hypothetical protein [Pseudomonadota bacterium]
MLKINGPRGSKLPFFEQFFWVPDDHSALGYKKIVSFGFAFFLLHLAMVLLLETVDSYDFSIGGNTWFFYPPAFVRLSAFLILGFWSVPFIFLAQIAINPFDLAWIDHFLLASFTAIGAPVGVSIMARAFSISRDLVNLNGSRLFMLSLAAACVNALAIRSALLITGINPDLFPGLHVTIIGDTLGAWFVMYIIKIALTLASYKRHR